MSVPTDVDRSRYCESDSWLVRARLRDLLELVSLLRLTAVVLSGLPIPGGLVEEGIGPSANARALGPAPAARSFTLLSSVLISRLVLEIDSCPFGI